MKKILYIFIVASLGACTGEKGEIGPKGENGAKGVTGPSGQVGPKGQTGDKGTPGDPGIQGETGLSGTTPLVSVVFSDWSEIGTWGKFSSDPIFYSTYKSTSKAFILNFIPNPDKLAISTYNSLGMYTVTHSVTNEIVGSLYVFNSLNTPNNGQVIFSNEYEDDDVAISDNSFSGFLDISSDLKTTPKLFHQLVIDFSETKYNASYDFASKLKEIKSKVRYIYIPVGLQAKNGRLSSTFKSYNELTEAYNIPK